MIKLNALFLKALVATMLAWLLSLIAKISSLSFPSSA